MIYPDHPRERSITNNTLVILQTILVFVRWLTIVTILRRSSI